MTGRGPDEIARSHSVLCSGRGDGIPIAAIDRVTRRETAIVVAPTYPRGAIEKLAERHGAELQTVSGDDPTTLHEHGIAMSEAVADAERPGVWLAVESLPADAVDDETLLRCLHLAQSRVLDADGTFVCTVDPDRRDAETLRTIATAFDECMIDTAIPVRGPA